jgi:hypothetical protein
MNTIKKLRGLTLILAMLALPIGPIAFFQGCAGTPNRVAYQTLSVTRISVEEGLGLYNEWDKAQHAKGINTAATDVKVNDLFQKWKAAQIAALQIARENSVATSTNLAGQTGLSALYQDAVDRAAQLKSDFLNLLIQVGVKIP